VPGAWQGRGLGNQFLDEIRRADALIHIVDASGGTDIEGKPCRPGDHDPLEDVKFLEHEIDMWLLQILKRDWDRIAKRAEGSREDISLLLEQRLSGLAIKRTQVLGALEASGLAADKPTAWKEDDLLRFAHNLRTKSKPILLSANKIDVAPAEENLKRLSETGYLTIPCCAEAELALRRAAEKGIVDYTPGDSSFRISRSEVLTEDQLAALQKIRDKILIPWGSTGVQASIDLAFFKLLRMIAVFPVEDAESLTDHQGRVLPDVYLVPYGTTAKQFASMIHSELGEGFLYAVEARSKMRIGEDHVLKGGDVVSILSAKKRG
jgi:ribosome-binding ATPase YchF (GTP1/OBG family)